MGDRFSRAGWDAILALACGARHTAQPSPSTTPDDRRSFPIPNGGKGDYEPEAGPRPGLAVARMMAHITYLSDVGDGEQVRPTGGRTGDEAKEHFDRPPPCRIRSGELLALSGAEVSSPVSTRTPTSTSPRRSTVSTSTARTTGWTTRCPPSASRGWLGRLYLGLALSAAGQTGRSWKPLLRLGKDASYAELSDGLQVTIPFLVRSPEALLPDSDSSSTVGAIAEEASG